MSYKDLLGPDGSENNMGGTRQFLSYAKHSDVLTWGTPDDAPADEDDKCVIADAHAMKTGKKFNKLYVTVDTSELEAAVMGEIDGRGTKFSLKFFHPGSKKDIIRFQNEAKNDKFVFLVPLSDGTVIQLGDENWCSYIVGGFKSDKTSGRGKGTEFTVECWMPEIFIYDAAIPYTPAS
ncbi:MAG: hypothetical protein WBP45_11075 [Daejeonella sp.]